MGIHFFGWRHSIAAAVILTCAATAAQAAGELLPDTVPTYSNTAVSTPYNTTFNSGVDTDYVAQVYGTPGKWYPIVYGSGTQAAAIKRETPPWTTASSEKALKLSPGTLNKVTRDGVQYVLPLSLKLNTRYRISMRVGTSSGSTVSLRVGMLGATTNYEVMPFVRQVTVPAGTAYKDVVINGVFAINEGPAADSARTLRIFPLTEGKPIYIDNLKIEEIDTSPVNMAHNVGFASTTNAALSMDNKMFGLHVNELGTHNTWPELGQTTVRLWGQPTMWMDLEPSQNAWAWNSGYDSLTYHMDYIQRNRPTADVIYTLGQTPTWASSNPTLNTCSYSYRAPGVCAPPKNLGGDWADWKDYVKTVATRHLGKIKYYEVWNEPGVANFFNAANDPADPNKPNPKNSAATMAAMACAAKDALKSADPNNTYGLKLVGPAVTGLWMDEFVEAGGADCVDILNFHAYVSPTSAENTLSTVTANIKFMMADYLLTDKPLWNTETGARCLDGGVQFCPGNYTPSDAVLRGTWIRSLAMQWANGVSNSNYFFMEGGFESWSGLVKRKPAGSTCQSSINGCLSDMTATPLGEGFAKAGPWLKNMKVTAAYTNATRDVFIFKAQDANTGAKRYLVWSNAATAKTVRFPYGWSIKTVEPTKGAAAGYSYNGFGIGADVSLNPLEPVLLKP